MPEELSKIQPEITMIAVTDLVIPDWNPRKFIDESETEDLVNYLRNGGIVPRILVWKGNDQAPWAVISGQRRLLAYERLKRTHIEAEIMDITLKQARVLATTANQGVEPYWLDRYEGWNSLIEQNELGQEELGDSIGRSQSSISRGMTLLEVLSPASRALIRRSVQKAAASQRDLDQNYQQLIKLPNKRGNPKPKKVKIQLLTEKAAYELTALLPNRSKTEAQTLAEKALPIILERLMNAPQVKALVASMKTETLAEAHMAAPKAPKALNQASASLQNTSPTADAIEDKSGISTPAEPQHVHPTHQAHLAETGSVPIFSATASQPKVSTQMGTAGTGSSIGTGTTKSSTDSHIKMESVQPNHGSRAETSTQATSAGGLSTAETVVYDALAGVSILAKVKAKLKKGERPTLAEIFLLIGHGLWVAIHWAGKHGFKFVKWFVKETWKLSKASIKGTVKALGPAISRKVGFVFNIVIFLIFLWFIWSAYQHGIVYPFKAAGSKIVSLFSHNNSAIGQTPQASVPAPVPVVNKPVQAHAVPDRPLVAANHSPEKSVDPLSTAVSQAQAPTVIPSPVKRSDVIGDAAGDVAKKLFGF